MTRTCDNCRRPVLATDTVCWHCGWKLSPPSPTTEITKPIDDEGQESAPKPSPLPLIVYYGGLTLLIIVVLLWLMNSLGQSPTVSGTGRPSTEWVALSDPEKQFTIEIPARWQWAFREKNQDQPQAAGLVDNEAWVQAAIAPLGILVPDSEQLLLAGDESTLLVIVRSERLNRLSPQQAVTSLRQESFEGIIVEDARQVQNSAGGNTAVFTINHETPALRCRQFLAPDSSTTFLVAACAASSNNDQFMDEFNTALDSFHLLSR